MCYWNNIDQVLLKPNHLSVDINVSVHDVLLE
jgi:hypothetical protein